VKADTWPFVLTIGLPGAYKVNRNARLGERSRVLPYASIEVHVDGRDDRHCLYVVLFHALPECCVS
jgi:hypothetical protein